MSNDDMVTFSWSAPQEEALLASLEFDEAAFAAFKAEKKAEKNMEDWGFVSSYLVYYQTAPLSKASPKPQSVSETDKSGTSLNFDNWNQPWRAGQSSKSLRGDHWSSNMRPDEKKKKKGGRLNWRHYGGKFWTKHRCCFVSILLVTVLAWLAWWQLSVIFVNSFQEDPNNVDCARDEETDVCLDGPGGQRRPEWTWNSGENGNSDSDLSPEGTGFQSRLRGRKTVSAQKDEPKRCCAGVSVSCCALSCLGTWAVGAFLAYFLEEKCRCSCACRTHSDEADAEGDSATTINGDSATMAGEPGSNGESATIAVLSEAKEAIAPTESINQVDPSSAKTGLSDQDSLRTNGTPSENVSTQTTTEGSTQSTKTEPATESSTEGGVLASFAHGLEEVFGGEELEEVFDGLRLEFEEHMSAISRKKQ